jgi:hypothetical protein
MSVEWRLRDEEETLLLVDASERVVSETSPPNQEMLNSFLTVSATVDVWKGWPGWRPVDGGSQEPERWGALVLSRADNGSVISIDPELYWERVYHWFRSRRVPFGP